MARRRNRRGRRTWPQRLLLLVNSLLVVACLGVAGTFNLVRAKASELPTIDIGAEARQRPDATGPRNILLVGTDSGEGLDEDDPVQVGREGENLADVIMILRVDPSNESASLLSIPRDTWVPIAPSWSKSKINSAFGGNDGPNTLIATIKHNFGISIDNYVKVDFKGFRDIIDVLGGIPVYNEHPISDRKTSLFLPETGCIMIDPVQALAYARSRHLRYQTGDTYDPKAKWITDGSSDLGRITRQQDFIRQAAQRAIDEGIKNPTTAYGLINAALGSVEKDDDLSVGEIQDLIVTFRDFSVQELTSEQIPTVSGGNPKISYQLVVWDQAEGLLDIYRGIREPGQVQPSDVIVGLPASVPTSAALSEQLDAIGFDAGTEDSSVKSSGKRPGTVIRYGLRGIEAARVLASWLDGEATYEFDADLPGRRLELLPGTAPLALLETARPLDQVPVPVINERRTGKGTTTTSSTTSTTVPTTSTTATSGSGAPSTTTTTTTTTAPESPTTTAIGFLPLDAERAASC
ncbi:MAG TPA: LCP family protein [Microthrixaceae bacterium]|nr:LCP family protein [Microthrixaceae bacterium]